MSRRDHAAAPPNACPDELALAALALGEAVADREALADHVVACPACAEDLRVLYALHREAQRTRRRGRARARAVASAVALAAVVLVAVGLAPLLSRGGGERTRAAAGTASDPADGSLLNEPPARLSWPAQVGARSYLVRVFHADGREEWQSAAMPATSVPLPAELRARLAGSDWYWKVSVEGSVQRRQLGPFWFTVRAR